MTKSDDPIVTWERCFQRTHPAWPYAIVDDRSLQVLVEFGDEEYRVTCGVDIPVDSAMEKYWYGAEYEFPHLAPERHRVAMGELLHTINEEFPGCVFLFQPDNGLITCRSIHPWLGDNPSDSWLNAMVTDLLEAVAHYRPRVLATCSSAAEPHMLTPLSASDLLFVPLPDSPGIWWI
jgi:hypothetical protein